MAADPTDAELITFATMATVVDWAGLLGDKTDANTPAGSFLAMLGAVPTTHPRTIGSIPSADFVHLVDTWTIGVGQGIAPTPVQRAQALLIGRAARIKAGFQMTLIAAAKAAAAPPAPPPPAQVGAVPADSIKLSLVTNQADDRLAPKLNTAELDACYANYRTVFDDYPTVDNEANADQLGAFKYLLDHDEIYVDFAVFGPHAIRIKHKLKMRGMSMDASGHLIPVQINGPPTFYLWSKCFGTLLTCLVSHNAAALGAIEAYKSWIQEYNDRYGSTCWHVIYQADVRMRQEQLERVRRRLTDAHAAALRAGGTTAFDPTRPWKLAFSTCLLETAWWKKEVEDPCMLLLTKTASLGTLLGEDALVERAGQTSGVSSTDGARELGGGVGGVRLRSSTGGAGSDRPPPKERKRTHNVQGGFYMSNRAGGALCPDFQYDTCQGKVSNLGRCPKGSHQCSRCLGKDHGSGSCSKPEPPETKTFGGKKGGKKKGGGRGKGYS
jgi:hypothetical protein